MRLRLPKSVRLAAMIAGCAAVSAPAAAQVRLQLSGGFMPDPQVIELQGGGEIEAATWIRGCPGWIAEAPALIIDLTNPSEALRFRAGGEGIAGLVLSGPDGVHRCVPAGADAGALLRVDPMLAGDYALWPAATEPGLAATAKVEVSEMDRVGLDSAGDSGSDTALQRDAEPAAGSHSLGDTALEIPVTLSGGQPASLQLDGCYGEIEASRPDAVIRLGHFEAELHVRVRSGEDTTLVVIGPEETLHCADDSYGLDPAIRIDGASAGDYAVWVGVYSGGGGAPATLLVDRSEAGVEGSATAGFVGPVENPFAGKTLGSAVEALQILLEEQGLSEVMTYETLEAEGDEGFTLTGVTIIDPTGEAPPQRIGRMRVAEVDLEGLAATGQPGRFAVSLEDIDYSALVEAGAAFQMPPLPAFADQPSLSLAVSLRPPADDASRRDLGLLLRLDGQFALGFEARVQWPEDGSTPNDMQALAAETLAFEYQNLGFLAALLEAQAAEMGMSPGELAGIAIVSLTEALGPSVPGSPQARLLAVAAEALGAWDRHGVVRLQLSADRPQELETLLEELKGDTPPSGQVDFELVYEPLP